MLDGDVCYDTYGLPYIPAKRIKGCLREAAEELRHMGDCLEDDKFRIDVEQIFGAEDRGVLILSNAKLMEKDKDENILHHEDFVSDLLHAKNEESQKFHQQQVISMFTYIRRMTKLNEHGSAEDTSLRSLRVLKKRLCFEADIDIDRKRLEEKTALSFDTVKKELELCCKALRHMGLHRTRVMGEVVVSVHELEEKQINSSDFSQIKESDADKVEKLDYKFELHAPAVMKNIEKGISKTQDYLDGSKIIGILAERIPREILLDILNDRYTVFSNAYISDDHWNRFTPVPASFRKYKDASDDQLIDHVSVTDQNRELIDGQLSALDKFYIFRENRQTYDYYRKDVETEIRYHHARAANKGIGSIGEDGAFYQVGSICEGQSLQGFIFAQKKYLGIMEQAFKQESGCRIGNMKNAEYGSAHLYIQTDKDAKKENWLPLKLRIRPEKKQMEKTDAPKTGSKNNGPGIREKFAVKLNAPMIMYNKNGMYSTDENDFTQLIKSLLSDDSVELKSSFKKYSMIGGFNTTWNMPKPVLSVLDKGSVFIFETNDICNAVAEHTICFAGERITEGYGELEFYNILDDFNGTLSEQKESEIYHSEKYQTSIIPSLARMILKNHCRSTGQRLADSYFGKTNPKASAILRVTNQFLHSMREYESRSKRKPESKNTEDMIKELEKNASDYKIKEKKTISEEILKLLNDSVKELDDPSLQWAAAQYKSDTKTKYNSTAEKFWKTECLKFMLEQLKYKCTEQIKKERKGGESDGI